MAQIIKSVTYVILVIMVYSIGWHVVSQTDPFHHFENREMCLAAYNAENDPYIKPCLDRTDFGWFLQRAFWPITLVSKAASMTAAGIVHTISTTK